MIMNELYNKEVKEEFLDTMSSDEVKATYLSTFHKSRGAEILYQKDLHSFSLEQIADVFKSINPPTYNSLNNSKTRINNYITWAINNGRRPNNINPIHGTTKEWGEQFLDTNAKRYFSDVEIYDITESLYNAQDQALIQCLFEGIMGKGYSELLSMNYKRIDWLNNIVEVKDAKDNQFRKVKVSDRCMKFIENAYRQFEYISEDTEQEKELIDFEGNIFKNTLWKNTMNKDASKGTLTKRLYIIKEKFELEEFTALNISESGRIKMAADLIKEKGELTKTELALIGDKFNLSKIKVNGYEYYNTSAMRNYISAENLEKMYDVHLDDEGVKA